MTWKPVAALAALMVASGIIGGVTVSKLRPASVGAQSTTITGGRFVLIDDEGILRATLETTRDGLARLAVVGPNSQSPRVSVAVDREAGSRVLLLDEAGATRISSEVRADGVSQVIVLGANTESPSTAISVQPSGATGLDLRDRQGRLRASLSLGSDGTPILALLDGEGNVVWSAP